jgi:hypothetical protein
LFISGFLDAERCQLLDFGFLAGEKRWFNYWQVRRGRMLPVVSFDFLIGDGIGSFIAGLLDAEYCQLLLLSS